MYCLSIPFQILEKSLFSSEHSTFLLENNIMLTVSRGFHSTGMKRMGGGHGHDEPYYLHAKHMYNLDRMKHQGLKMSLAVFTAFSIGVAVPVYAVIFQQKKTASSQARLFTSICNNKVDLGILDQPMDFAVHYCFGLYVQPSIWIFQIYLIIINFSARSNTRAWTLSCFAFLQSVLICSFLSFYIKVDRG